MKNKLVAITVPFYNNSLTRDEEISLKQLSRFKNKFDLISFSPKGITVPKIFDKTLHFESKYFKNTSTYSRLLLETKFYEKFVNYKFILIYQLDCLVFSDDLNFWCNQEYDYIGAPFFRNKYIPYFGLSRVGNGGLSLRKVEIFIRILKQKESPKVWNFLLNKLPDKSFLDVKKRFSVYRQISKGVKWYTENYTLNEDLFWSDRAKLFYPNFKIAPLKVGLKFAFDMHPKFCFKRNKNTLPFGAHGWQKRDKTFWLDILRDIND